MSDWIEQDGKRYYEASYLKLANRNAKRHFDRLKALEHALSLEINQLRAWAVQSRHQVQPMLNRAESLERLLLERTTGEER